MKAFNSSLTSFHSILLRRNNTSKIAMTCICLFITSTLPAQLATINNDAAKVNGGALSVLNANNSVNNASNTILNTKQTVGNVKSVVGSLFGGKKKKEAEQSAQLIDTTKTPLSTPTQHNLTKQVSISITNISYSKLKLIEDSLKNIAGVTSTIKKFTPTASNIDIVFSGRSDELWDLLPTQLKDMFELKDVEDGKIVLESKK